MRGGGYPKVVRIAKSRSVSRILTPARIGDRAIRIVPRGVVYLTFSQYDDSEPEPDRSVSRDGQADNGIIADG